MKSLLLILPLVALAGVATAGPIAISDNNIGDIITVGMNIDANVQSEVNTNIANIIAAILVKMGDQQRPPRPPPGPPGPPGPPPPPPPPPPTTPAPPVTPTLPPGPPQPPAPPTPPQPPVPPTPPQPPVMPTISPVDPTFVPPQPIVEDLVSAIREIRQKASVADLSKEQKEQLWRDHAEDLVQKLMANNQ